MAIIHRVVVPACFVLLTSWLAAGGAAGQPVSETRQPAAPTEEAWRALLPDGWLAIASLRPDLDSVDAEVATLLDDLSFNYESALATAREVLELANLELGAGRLVIGVAETPANEASGSERFEFFLLPIRSFEEAISALGGEVVGDVGIATLLGKELCLAPCGDWLFIVDLEHLDIAQARMASAVDQPATAGPTHDFTAELSADGMAWVAKLSTRAGNEATRRRVLRGLLRWPPNFDALKAATAENAPLVEGFRELFTTLQTSVDLGVDHGVSWRLAGCLSKPAPQASAETGAALPDSVTASSIASVQGSGRGPVSHTLLRLLLAYYEGRPDEIEARAYPNEAFAEFADRVFASAQRVDWFDAAIVTHADGDLPLYSNQAALLTVDRFDTFASALEDVFASWNRLVAKSGAATELVFAKRPFGRDQFTGVEFHVDMVDAVDVGVSPEVRRLMDQFFGDGGRYTWRLIQVSDRLALLTDLPWAEARALAEQVEASPQASGGPKANGDEAAAGAWKLSVDPVRYLAWQRRVTQLMQGRPLVRYPLADAAPEARIESVVRIDDGVLTATTKAPRQSLRAIGDSLRREREKR